MNPHSNDPVLAGLLGVAIGDALGVPVEFQSRSCLDATPVVTMRGGGTYGKPAGTWSDDTSLTLALADSLASGRLDYANIMDGFIAWQNEGAYTPDGKMFDIGITTSEALLRYRSGRPPVECGGAGERDNGNGSLMRILPIVFYLRSEYGQVVCEEGVKIIHDVSAFTHAHPRSQTACVLYCSIAHRILEGDELGDAICQGFIDAQEYYLRAELHDHYQALHHFLCSEPCDDALLVRYHSLAGEARDSIKSGGYVVNTLDASLWCLLNHDGYRDTVLAAVNLGGDTDTTAAVCGGLAGLYYTTEGPQGIPSEWADTLAGLPLLQDICARFAGSLKA